MRVKSILAILFLMTAGLQPVLAQDIKTLMTIHKTDGTVSSVYVDEVDSISFTQMNQVDTTGTIEPGEDATLLTSLINRDEECSLFYEALEATGLCEVLDHRYKDEIWDSTTYQSSEKVYDLPTFSQYCHLPNTRENGHTVMVCTNEVLDSLYGIHDLQGFYNFALSIYEGNTLDVDSESEALRLEGCPLRKLLSYCIIDRKSTLERLTTLCSIDTLVAQPTEWYSTLLPLSTIKVTKSEDKTFLNMTSGMAGIRISEPKGNHSSGYGSYYLIDGLPLYNDDCRLAFASERMRMDVYTLIPELENVKMRSSKTATAPASATKTNAISKSYFIPSDYLQSISASKETYMIYENVHNVSQLYEGDGIWLCGRYDVTLKLPAVPKSGIYEIRLGYTAFPNPGICQIYFGTDPNRLAATGIPINLGQDANAINLPWIPLTDDSYTDDQKSDSRHNMRNYGYMHGPASVYNVCEPGLEDNIMYIDKRFCDNQSTLRSIIVRQTLNDYNQYYLRLKSVMDGDKPICIDYIEIVSKNVYDNPETEEDIF